MSQGLIDVHAHLPVGAMSHLFAGRPPSTTGSLPAVEWTPESAIDAMDRQGVRARLLSMPQLFVSEPPDSGTAARSARTTNNTLAAVVADHPDRFGAFATLPADTSDGALAELEALGLPADQLDAIRHGNAASLFPRLA